MMNPLFWISATAFPPRTGRTPVKHHLRDGADPLVGSVQSGKECLIRSQVSLVMPLQMAGKQEQRILVSRRGGSFRQRGFRRPCTCPTIASPNRVPILASYLLLPECLHSTPHTSLPDSMAKSTESFIAIASSRLLRTP